MKKKGVVPCPGIDTDAQWGTIVIPRRDGFSDTNYILHRQLRRCRKIVVPLTADVTTVNIPDNQIYVPLTSLSSCILFTICIVYGS